MRKKRIIYMNDARHYYLFVFEPPMTTGGRLGSCRRGCRHGSGHLLLRR